MRANNLLTESRDVRDFEQVSVRAYNMETDLQIVQGERESLTLEGRPDVLSRIVTQVQGNRLAIRVRGSWLEKLNDALATSLTRRRITLHLTVRDLTYLEVCGVFRIHASELRTSRLALKLRGVGQVHVERLTANRLEADLSGTVQANLAGQVAEQQIAMSGVGRYHAPGLKSQRASLLLKGPGGATIWVIDDLDVAIHGLGAVKYYGTPTVNRQVRPLGTVTCLGTP